jgi:hypothetical protein
VRIGCAFTVLAAARPAFAQPDPRLQPRQPGPFAKPIFGSGAGPIDQSLIANLALGFGHDVEKARGPQVVPAGVDPNQTLYAFTGQHLFGHANLHYGLGFGRLSGGASLRTTAFHYTQNSTSLRVNSGASLYVNAKLWRGSNVGVRHEITYAPIQYHFQTDPSGLNAVDPQGNLIQDPSLTFDPTLAGRSEFLHRTTIDFNQPLAFNITQRLSVNWGYAFQGGDENLFGQSSHSFRVGLAYQMAKGLALRSGYSQGFSRYRTSPTESEWTSHGTIDAGLDFSRQLSFLRRMSLSFWTGIATLNQGDHTNFTGIGGVGLGWNVGHGWNAGANISRNVQFVDEFANISLGNNLSGYVHGSLTDWLSIHGRVGTWSYDVAGSGDTHVKTLYTRIGVSSPLTSFLSAGVDYTNALHSVGDGVVIRPGVPRERNRHGIRAHLSMSAPLFSMTRRQQ